jgi:uncharacterized membrane protein YuzA (DUF378 family)
MILQKHVLVIRMDKLFLEKWLFKTAMVLLIVGALNWATVAATGTGFVERLLGAKTIPTRVVYGLVGIAALAIMFNRDTYLPFLGETVLPCSALPEQIPENADTKIEVKATPGAKVLYWAAEPETEGLKNVNDWRKAYLKFMNVGVTIANSEGVAELLVRNPQPYVVPWKGRLEPHIHFRICGDNGMMGRIKTVFLHDGHVEGFRPQ